MYAPQCLFIIAKIWKKPKCPSVDGWIKKIYTYTHRDTHTKRNSTEALKEILCNSVDGPRVYYAK